VYGITGMGATPPLGELGFSADSPHVLEHLVNVSLADKSIARTTATPSLETLSYKCINCCTIGADAGVRRSTKIDKISHVSREIRYKRQLDTVSLVQQRYVQGVRAIVCKHRET
jgi:hypothetical protein